MSRLTQIVSLSHRYLAEVLRPGDSAVDLTAGNGHDTLFLRQSVGAEGTVYAFDLQLQAVLSAAHRLQEAGYRTTQHRAPAPAYPPGIHLITASHEFLPHYVNVPVRGVIANLGYLPGGDKQIITRAASTLPALQHAASALCAGGRLAVVVYTGHPGGSEEAEQVGQWFADLEPDGWGTLRITLPNQPAAPCLLVAEKNQQPKPES